MEKEWKLQQERITTLSRNLRFQYFHRHKDENCCFSTPHGIAGNPEESIGAWPEFIFRGTFCARTFAGFCSPCFYSQFPAEKSIKGLAYQDMIRKQINYVIEHFKELVVDRQIGKPNPKEVSFVLTPTGSFFDDHEFPQHLRIEMLQGLVNAGTTNCVSINLLVECHCKDWNKLDKNTPDSQIELNLLRLLRTKLLFGFESVNEYTRNVLYNKHLELSELDSAYQAVIEESLTAGVFIFAGLFSMNDRNTIEDVCTSIDFAFEKGLTPVLMFQNVQQHTISELLFTAGKITLLEPFSVLLITQHLIEEAGKYSNADWLIADPKGGPPAPEFNIFDCARITSTENSNRIYKAICELRRSRDTKAFLEETARIFASENHQQYIESINQEEGQSIEVRTDCLLDDAEMLYEQIWGELK